VDDKVAHDRVVEANRELLLERSRVGLRKYGEALHDFPHDHEREILQHALEEALDFCNYLQTRIMAIDHAQ